MISVTQIALDCGFNDLSYFIRSFKKLKGITPKKYRAGKEDESSKSSKGMI